jgi:geranylgeranyl diphosphate synthase, type II
MSSPDRLLELIQGGLHRLPFQEKPETLYEPIRYMLQLGGKRMRPVLVLMATELYNSKPEPALSAALGIEVFHNFTLLHDDIMDNAPLRRAKPTVHAQWNSNIAILSGDAMFVKACDLMMQVPDPVLRKVLDVFYKTALEVCEGQQFDMDFEQEESVPIESYLNMIRLKTAVLLGCSLEIGGYIGGASDTDAKHLYDFGVNLGLAFQLQDDILDVYADANKFGKQVGGDIIANKKTFLLLTAINTANGELKEELMRWINQAITPYQYAEKVDAITRIYAALHVRETAEAKMKQLYNDAFVHLDAIPVSNDKKDPLRTLAKNLLVREN